MARENVTGLSVDQQYRDFLTKEGCVFHPKQEIVLPAVSVESLIKNYGDDCYETVQTTLLPNLYNFVKRPVITDQFGVINQAGDDHNTRRKWREHLPLDVRRYYENNQLRANHISVVLSTLEVMIDLSLKPDENLRKSHAQLMEEYRGCNELVGYVNQPDSEKIKFTHKVELAVKDVLDSLSN